MRSGLLLSRAKESPAAVARHDREAWLALFHPEAEIHDPVGSRPHTTAKARENFYATFIAPNQIEFLPEFDICCEDTVVRDLIIRTQLGATGLSIDVPLFIRYRFESGTDTPRVVGLFAHWELWPMLRDGLLGAGWAKALQASWALGRNMLAHQGLSGALGFCRALGGQSKMAEQRLIALLSQDSDQASVHREPNIRWNEAPISLSDCLHQLEGVHWEKLIQGGPYISCRLHLPAERGILIARKTSAGQLDQIDIYSSAG